MPADEQRAEALRQIGATVVCQSAGQGGGVDIDSVLKDLAVRGKNDLLVEGGARVASSFLAAKLVDRIALFCAPVELGADGVDALAGRSLDAVKDGRDFVPDGTECHGEDVLDWYVRKE